MKKKVTLFCMTEKGYRVLETMVSHSPQIIECVVSSRDSNIKDDYYDQIVALCKLNGISVHDRAVFKEVESHYSIAVSWRWLIDSSLTNLVVFHDSILPKYRGFAPLVSSLINGETEIGVTALFASENYDCGDIILQSTSSIDYPIKVQRAIKVINENYKELTNEIVKKIVNGIALHGIKQDDTKASYSLWRDENDYRIDWTQNAEQVLRFIDAVGYPYKGASTIADGKKIRILEVQVVDDLRIENRTPGKIIYIQEDRPVVVCGEGLLMILNAVNDETEEPLLPFPKFRLRLE
jgi:methionyl-tRNA formyltransferase